jgi:hypothetical protein
VAPAMPDDARAHAVPSVRSTHAGSSDRAPMTDARGV